MKPVADKGEQEKMLECKYLLGEGGGRDEGLPTPRHLDIILRSAAEA
jgi:hypothetical protein